MPHDLILILLVVIRFWPQYIGTGFRVFSRPQCAERDADGICRHECMSKVRIRLCRFMCGTVLSTDCNNV